MKKMLMITLVFFVSIISGCSSSRVQDQFTDQNPDISFMDYYIEEYNLLKLSNLWLKELPDLCALLDADSILSIKEIDVSGNEIEAFDRDYSCFSQLHTLDVSFNVLRDLWSIVDLTSLRMLSVQKNALQSINGVKKLTNLRELNVGFNMLDQLPNLEWMNLVKLFLNHNTLSDIKNIVDVSSLVELRLEFNELNDSALVTIEQLPNLKFVTLAGNGITQGVVNSYNEQSLEYQNNLQKQ